MGLFTRQMDMDEDGRLVSPPYSTPRSLTAAATRVTLRDNNEVAELQATRAISGWQSRAWDYYDLIGEIKYSALLIGSILSRIRIYPAIVTDDDMAPTPLKKAENVDEDLVEAARATLKLLETGPGGIGGILSTAGMNLFIAGECFLVEQPSRSALHTTTWQIRSVDEVSVRKVDSKKNEVVIKKNRNASSSGASTSKGNPNEIVLPSTGYISRIWKMHPRFSNEADSSLLGLLEPMDELLLLSKSARATIKSRLNAGILLLPDDLSNISEMDGVTVEEVDPEDPVLQSTVQDDDTDFEEELIAAMITPISDEASASAVVPLIIRGPGEALDKIKHISTSRAFDAQHTDRETKLLDRILAGLDLPKELVAGVADSKYANATVVEESFLRDHIEPAVLLIIDSLTNVFLRPYLRAMNQFSEEQISDIVLWYDPSAITVRPSKSDAATTGYNIQALSGKAWRRANGFSEGDKPSETEVAQRMAISRGLISENISEALLRTLIPDLMEKVKQDQIAAQTQISQDVSMLQGDQVPDQDGAQPPTNPETGENIQVEEVPSNLIEP